MKYTFVRLEVVNVLTPTLCHGACAGNKNDYPEAVCTLFGGWRELSESEGVHAYKRLPACIETVMTPYKPDLPKVGSKLTFRHTGIEYVVAEVRELPDSDDDWEVRLDPPLEHPYHMWLWIAKRYFK